MTTPPPSSPPPCVGSFRPEDDERFEEHDHMRGWTIAVKNALDSFGRDPGHYDVTVELCAKVRVENPGSVVEYIAKIT